MLLESYNRTEEVKNAAQLATAKRFMEVLLNSNLKYHEALKYLSARERELLEEDKFVQAKKKQMGRV